MKTIKIIFFLLFAILTAFSCEKSKNEQTTTCYDETKGSDPWAYAENDSVLITNVRNYLNSHSIVTNSITISNDGTYEACKATSCKTGRKIKTVIDNPYLDKIKNLRFYECK